MVMDTGTSFTMAVLTCRKDTLRTGRGACTVGKFAATPVLHQQDAGLTVAGQSWTQRPLPLTASLQQLPNHLPYRMISFLGITSCCTHTQSVQETQSVSGARIKFMACSVAPYPTRVWSVQHGSGLRYAAPWVTSAWLVGLKLPQCVATASSSKGFLAGGLGSARPSRCLVLRKAKEESQGGDPRRDQSLDDYVEVKVDSVRVSANNSIVYLRLLSADNLILQVHIGEHESSALLKEISKGRVLRPLTHDLTKNILGSIGYRVTKIRITDIVSNTYYARIHVARVNAQGMIEGEEVDVDARPSDAINLAVRFGAPMYVNKRIAEIATAMPPPEAHTSPTSESQSEIVRSVREALASFEDPTIMYQLQKELAIKDQRYEDARVFQNHIYHEMTHNQLLRLVVAMEAALSDQRFEEAARLRDEYRRVVATQVSSEQKR